MLLLHLCQFFSKYFALKWRCFLSLLDLERIIFPDTSLFFPLRKKYPHVLKNTYLPRFMPIIFLVESSTTAAVYTDLIQTDTVACYYYYLLSRNAIFFSSVATLCFFYSLLENSHQNIMTHSKLTEKNDLNNFDQLSLLAAGS